VIERITAAALAALAFVWSGAVSAETLFYSGSSAGARLLLTDQDCPREDLEGMPVWLAVAQKPGETPLLGCWGLSPFDQTQIVLFMETISGKDTIKTYPFERFKPYPKQPK